MNKTIKILIGIIALLIVLIIAGFIAIRAYLTPSTVRMIAEKVASEAIKRPVQIGKVSLYFGFRIGIAVEDVSIKNTKEFGATPMVQVEKTTLHLKLLPLIRRQIVISSIDLKGLSVNLQKNKTGDLNIATFLPKEQKGSGWAFSLSSIKITDGELHFEDKKDGVELRLKDIKHTFSMKKAAIHATGKQTVYLLKHNTLPEMVVKIQNDIVYDGKNQRIELKKFEADYEPLLLVAKGSVEKMERLDIKATIKVADASKLRALIPINARPADLTGTITTECTILGTVKAPKVDGKCELKNVTLVPKGMHRGLEKINGTFSFDNNNVRNILLNSRVGNAKVSITGSVSNLKQPSLNLSAKVDGDLKDFEMLTTDMQGIIMRGPVSIAIDIKGSTKNPTYGGEYAIRSGTIEGIGLDKPVSNFNTTGTFKHSGATITKCNGTIGQSDFSFSGTLSGFTEPVVTVKNASKTIDLDELMPKTKKPKGEKSSGVPLTIKGTTTVVALTGLDMVYRNVSAEFSYVNGIIDVKNCRADAFNGKVDIDFYYNPSNPEPYRIRTRMNSVSAKQLLKRFLKLESIEGSLTGVSSFQGKGFDVRQIIANLSASGNLKVINGHFRNYPFLAGLFSWLGIKDNKDIPFKDFNVYFNIDNGSTKVNDWALSSSVGDLLTNGTINLSGKVNLDITATLSKKYSDIVKKFHGDWIFPIDNKGRAIIDIKVSGSLTSPKFSLNKEKIKKRIQGKVKDEFEKKKKEWEKKLKDLLKGGG